GLSMRATIGFNSAIAAGQSLALILARTEVRSTAAFGGSLSTARLGGDAAGPTLGAATGGVGNEGTRVGVPSLEGHCRFGSHGVPPGSSRGETRGRPALFPRFRRHLRRQILAVGPTQASQQGCIAPEPADPDRMNRANFDRGLRRPYEPLDHQFIHMNAF